MDFPAESEIEPLMTEKLFYNYKIFSVNPVAFYISIANGCQASYIIQYFQLIFNYSPLIALCNFMPSMLSISTMVLITGYDISKTGRIKEMAILSATTGLLGNGLLTLLKDTSNEAENFIFVFLAGISYGFMAQSSLMSAQRELDSTDKRYRMDFVSVTGHNMFNKQLGQCIGSVFATMLFSTSVINGIKSNFPEYSFLKADTLIAFRRKKYDGKHSPFSKLLSKGIQNVFYFATGISVIPVLVCWFVSSRKIMTKAQAKRMRKAEELDSKKTESIEINHESKN